MVLEENADANLNFGGVFHLGYRHLENSFSGDGKTHCQEKVAPLVLQ